MFFLEDPLSPEDHRLFSPDPPELRNADRHGRTLQQPARVAAVDLGAIDRLHSRSRVADRRIQPRTQNRDHGGTVRRQNGLAWPGRCFTSRDTWQM